MLEAFLNKYIYTLGIPTAILTDQGTTFEAKTIKSMCEALGIRKMRTSHYYPQCDGITERANRTILQMLSKSIESVNGWLNSLDALCFAYNTSVNETNTISPFEMIYRICKKRSVERESTKTSCDSMLNEKMYEVGPRVFVSYPKFCQKRRGPYKIITVLEPNINFITAKGEMIVHKKRSKIAYRWENNLIPYESSMQTVADEASKSIHTHDIKPAIQESIDDGNIQRAPRRSKLIWNPASIFPGYVNDPILMERSVTYIDTSDEDYIPDD
ncbi:hypothetical protein RF11_08913 [Thelohanellus kitauei]|uniref:Integrase catalytic domain-containing protein n=1 Tax=Thelohanellus kitauei TaxID=669202 RepID=A0A0C2JZA8_THEKT|nr:hypothetical protein RF11_08913 [Thelohanellus kitauei]